MISDSDYDPLMNLLICVVCERPLKGRQRRFCSRRCKNSDTNNKHQNYTQQQARGWSRKLMLLNEAGARCIACGYSRNLAALVWHHVDPKKKAFSLDLRSMSNRSEADIRREVEKCVMLCANCHMETHHPKFDRISLSRKTKKPA